MQVNFLFPKQKPVLLADVKPGSIIRFADSGQCTSDPVEAIANTGQSFFMVFKDDKPVSGRVDLASIDGQIMIRKRGNRLVTVHGDFDSPYSGSPAFRDTCLSSVPLGSMVVYGIDPDILLSLKNKKLRKCSLYMVVKGNPNPAGETILVSTHGDKVYADDDIGVRVFENYTVDLNP